MLSVMRVQRLGRTSSSDRLLGLPGAQVRPSVGSVDSASQVNQRGWEYNEVLTLGVAICHLGFICSGPVYSYVLAE